MAAECLTRSVSARRAMRLGFSRRSSSARKRLSPSRRRGEKRADVRRTPTLEPGEHGKRAPVIDERLDAFLLYALRESLVPAPATLAGILLEPGVGADGEEREHSIRAAGRDVKRQPATHRVAGEMGPLDSEVVPHGQEVLHAGVHRARRTVPRLGFAVTTQVRHDPLPAAGHLADDLAPAATGLRETVQHGDWRAFAFDKVAEPDVLTLQNHESIL